MTYFDDIQGNWQNRGFLQMAVGFGRWNELSKSEQNAVENQIAYLQSPGVETAINALSYYQGYAGQSVPQNWVDDFNRQVAFLDANPAPTINRSAAGNEPAGGMGMALALGLAAFMMSKRRKG